MRKIAYLSMDVHARNIVMGDMDANGTRHLKPVLLIKEIVTNDPYFVNYLRDAILV